jgi:hypothetical protein
MTAPPLLETPALGYATATSICGQAGCGQLILPGQQIIKPGPGRSWRHIACEHPRHIGGGPLRNRSNDVRSKSP